MKLERYILELKKHKESLFQNLIVYYTKPEHVILHSFHETIMRTNIDIPPTSRLSHMQKQRIKGLKDDHGCMVLTQLDVMKQKLGNMNFHA